MTAAAKTKKSRTSRSSRPPDRTVVYRGIKIAPITGRRSPLAQAIRDGLRGQFEQSRGKLAQA